MYLNHFDLIKTLLSIMKVFEKYWDKLEEAMMSAYFLTKKAT